MSELGLTIGGTRFTGWQEVSVDRSIENISGGFEIVAAETELEDPPARAFRPGQKCTIDLDGDVVVTGWIDAVTVAWDDTDHTITVRGRDVTGDLVDCSVEKIRQMDGRTLDQIVSEICKPFGIQVRSETDTGIPFETFTVSDGDEAFAAIERACRIRAVLPVSDGLGALVLTRAGTARASGELELGVNILAASFERSDEERFSEYVVRYQQQPQSGWAATASTEQEGKAKDAGVARYRPRIIIGETQGDGATFSDRATWEASVRLGRSLRGSYTVAGWTDGAGATWKPNTIVRVRDPLAGIDTDLLIASVEFTKGPDGTRTVLTVSPRTAFDLIPVPETKDEGLELWNR